MYSKAIEFAGLSKEDIVLDAYCGIGTITLSVAKYVKKVYGVEIVETAIDDAKNNAVLNNISNAEFKCSDAGNQDQHLDVVFVDPPRKGCSTEFLDNLIQAEPKKIIYISCDVATQARDIKYLQEFGYHADVCQPVYMFPHTTHIENIVRLSK